MATIDISREAFDPRKHYSSVRMQQGRVIVDDDWNENERIENEDRRRARVDVIGSSGSPDQGFRITKPKITKSLIDFDILPGSFYLGGLRLEIDQQESYRTQKDWLQQPHDIDPGPDAERYDLVYLEAWQQPVGAVEDSELFEVALGGPDTSMRIRNMYRIRLEPDVESNDCALAWQKLVADWKMNKESERVPKASLKVTFVAAGNPDDLCTPLAAGGYLGAENQAIRVQIVDQTHLTWGFDNASPLYRVEVDKTGTTVTLLTDPKDQAHWPLAGQIVEILPWSAVLPNGEKLVGIQGHLSRVKSSYDPDEGTLTLMKSLPASFGKEWTSRDDKTELKKPSEYFFMRVWNRGADRTSEAKIAFTPGTPVSLGKTGLKITITGNDRVAGDYWIIAARPETPKKVVPWKFEQGLAPHGVKRFFAPLALIRWKQQGQQITGKVIRDCRKTFRPLTDLETCCTYSVGDGVHSQGDFNSIEEAIHNLPAEGGKICVLPGRHYTNVTIDQRQQIKIVGCGFHTIVHPTDKGQDQPIFLIKTSERISIENMTLVTSTGTAIQVEDHQNIRKASREIFIEENHIIALTHAIDVRVYNELGGNNDIRIADNEVAMFNMAEGGAAIFCLADNVVIERNRVGVVPAPDPDDTNDPWEPGPGDDIFELCADLLMLYAEAYPINNFIHSVFLFLNATNFFKQISYLAQGGIQIGGGSEKVKIIRNRIIGGNGNGITLGHVPEQNADGSIGIRNEQMTYYPTATDEEFNFLRDNMIPFVYDVSIEDNMILNMGLSGIGVPAFFKTEKKAIMFSVEDLTVYRNRIEQCAHLTPEETPEGMLDEIGFGGVVLAACENAVIQENRIENNGKSQLEPVCGILILYAEKIDVSNNRIINNGPRTFADDKDAKRGLRGGIVIKMGFRQILNKVFDRELLFPDGVPAVKVHNNIVTHPFGQALFIMAFGPVSVIGNHLTSQSADYLVNSYSLLAGAVFILNLGVSKDLIASLLLQGFKYLAAAGPITSKSAVIRRFPAGTTVSELVGLIQRILYLPGGNVLFANNQTTLDLRQTNINFAFSAQTIASLDDIAYNSNQSECTSLLDFLYTDVALLGVTIRTNDNRFQEGLTVTLNSLFSFGFMNMASTNQATHCLQVFGVPAFTQAPANSVLYQIGCLDETAMVGNHLAVQPLEMA